MFSGRDVILISSIEWDFNWQGHQEIATRLARAGNRVLYVENMGVRAPGLRDARRVAQRFSHWAGSLLDGGVRQVAPDLYVCSPLIMPPFGSWLRHQLNRRFLLPMLRRVVRNLDFDPTVVWTFLPTDTVASFVRMLRGPEGVVVYYCIADFAELTPNREDILQSEREIIELSDIIFAQGPHLAEHCSRTGKHAEVFPFGVNIDRFSRNGHPPGPAAHVVASSSNGNNSAASLMKDLPRPVIGYVGGIHKFFDVEMLTAMARARPEWSFVLVGPLQTSAGELKRLPNVHLAGQKPHEELAEYIRGFDVGIVPYLFNTYTATVVPTKINEYLAMGKPVVSTNLPEVSNFNGKHGVIITSPNRAKEFAASIERALLTGGEESSVTRRREVAALHDWEARYERMSLLIEQELRRKKKASPTTPRAPRSDDEPARRL
ncbi:MAG: glycosyltransferase [Acidobacteria bacterium]|nr:glycosyltransferase [Acidobacteriota bacterium]MCA1618402.1 glycosyltransferase [Acidobacteriota bacterium]